MNNNFLVNICRARAMPEVFVEKVALVNYFGSNKKLTIKTDNYEKREEIIFK